MKTRHSLNVISFICLVSTVCFICYVLREDDVLPLSICSVWSHANHLVGHFHVLAVGFLPVYVALMIFGTAMVGVYFGAILHRWICYLLHNK